MNAYETSALKFYVEHRREIYIDGSQFHDGSFSKLTHHAAVLTTTISSFLSFLLSVPIVQSLTNADRTYLCKHNVRPLTFPHMHEIEQNCYSEPWQVGRLPFVPTLLSQRVSRVRS